MNLMFLFLWLLSLAHAALHNVTVCGEVNIQLINGSTAGPWTYWTVDTDDKPARGFRYKLMRKVGSVYTLVTDSYVADSGDEGCVTMVLDSNEQYQFTFYSKASVSGNTIEAVDDSTSLQQASATVLFNYSPTGTDEMTFVLNGGSDDRWNHLAMAAFALYFENAGVSGMSVQLQSTGGIACCRTIGNSIELYSTIKQFTVIHELGHVLSTKVNGNNAPTSDCSAVRDNCDGGGDSGAAADHGTVTKEYYSCAIVEGMGDWYAAITWNDISTSATSCWYLRGHDIDFNLNGSNDYLGDLNPYPCTGDPHSDAWLDGDDWLEDAIGEGAGACTTPLQNRSTQFDVVRYLFAMRTEEDLTKQKLWDIWDDAEPHTWDVNGGGGSNDPEERWETSADSNLVGGAHDDQKHHGLDH